MPAHYWERSVNGHTDLNFPFSSGHLQSHIILPHCNYVRLWQGHTQIKWERTKKEESILHKRLGTDLWTGLSKGALGHGQWCCERHHLSFVLEVMKSDFHCPSFFIFLHIRTHVRISLAVESALLTCPGQTDQEIISSWGNPSALTEWRGRINILVLLPVILNGLALSCAAWQWLSEFPKVTCLIMHHALTAWTINDPRSPAMQTTKSTASICTSNRTKAWFLIHIEETNINRSPGAFFPFHGWFPHAPPGVMLLVLKIVGTEGEDVEYRWMERCRWRQEAEILWRNCEWIK